VAGQEPLTVEVTARRVALASPTPAVVLGAVVLVLVIAGLTLSGLDRQLTLSRVGAGPAAS
jgi:hypothetical protein